MNSITIRLADKQDTIQLMLLLEELEYPQQSLEALQKRLELFYSQSGYGVAVAEQENLIVGFIGWSKSLLLAVPKTRIHIEGLIVTKKYRNQGIGKKLINYLESIAQSYSPCIVDLTSHIKRAKDGTHAFYKALGYSNEGDVERVYLRKQV